MAGEQLLDLQQITDFQPMGFFESFIEAEHPTGGTNNDAELLMIPHIVKFMTTLEYHDQAAGRLVTCDDYPELAKHCRNQETRILVGDFQTVYTFDRDQQTDDLVITRFAPKPHSHILSSRLVFRNTANYDPLRGLVAYDEFEWEDAALVNMRRHEANFSVRTARQYAVDTQSGVLVLLEERSANTSELYATHTKAGFLNRAITNRYFRATYRIPDESDDSDKTVVELAFEDRNTEGGDEMEILSIDSLVKTDSGQLVLLDHDLLLKPDQTYPIKLQEMAIQGEYIVVPANRRSAILKFPRTAGFQQYIEAANLDIDMRVLQE